MKDLSEKVKQIIEPVLAGANCELYDLKIRQNKGLTLVISIDHESGVNLDLCAKVSREISLVLDVEELFNREYTLEVSSPGIFRELRTEKDFVRFKGQRIKTVYVDENDNNIKQITGFLEGFDPGQIFIKNEKGETVGTPRENVNSVKLEPAFAK